MFIQKVVTPGLAVHSYVVGDKGSLTCAVIDPTRDVQKFIAIAKGQGLEIKYILETHVHADFLSGSFELKKALGDQPIICCSSLGGLEWTPDYADRKIQDGDTISFGQLVLKAIHTPGHTPEHISWELYEEGQPKMYFSGDFVFIGDVGRPDLLGEAEQSKLAHRQYASIFQGLIKLPGSLELMPAHGKGSLCGKAIGGREKATLADEWRENPSLQKKPEESWIADLMRGMPKAPPYFLRMKKINVTGAPLLLGKLPGRHLEGVQADDFVLDVRSIKQFQAGYLKGAINIAFSPQLSFWAGWLVPPDRPIVLVMDRNQEIEPVVWQLLRIGLDNIKGWIYADQLELNVTLQAIEESEIGERLIVDVRSQSEWEEGHLPNAHHIPLGEIRQRVNELPKQKPIAVVCHRGYRATVGASYLLTQGFTDVSAVIHK